MKVVRREGNSLQFAVADLEHPQFKYRTIEVHAVPVIGRRHYYRTLKDRLDNAKSLFGDEALIINATIEDDFRDDSDSTGLGNGFWSDWAHIMDHSVLDETIPFTEYITPNLKLSKLLPLIRRTKDKYLEQQVKEDKLFEEADTSYDAKRSMSYFLGWYLRYKYSSCNFMLLSFLYPKLYDRIAQDTVNVLVSNTADETENIIILVDPYALNATVKALKAIGYKQYFDYYAPYITLPL